MFRSWWRNRGKSRRSPARQEPPARRTFKPEIETLEGREVPVVLLGSQFTLGINNASGSLVDTVATIGAVFNPTEFLPAPPANSDGYTVSANGTDFTNSNSAVGFAVTIADTSSGSFHGVRVTGTPTGGLSLERTVSFIDGNQFATFAVTLTNTGATPINNLLFNEHIDPLSAAATFNDVVQNGSFARASTLAAGPTIGFGSRDGRRVMGFNTLGTIPVPLVTYFAAPLDPAGASTANGLNAGFNFGTLEAGASVTVQYELVFGTDPAQADSNFLRSTNRPLIAVGADAGGGPLVRAYDPPTGTQLLSFLAYGLDVTGGVRVATGDVNADGVDDIVTAPGPGSSPLIRVFDGATGQVLPSAIGQFFAFSPAFTGGVNLACGDVTKDGFADVIIAADAGGGPHVVVFSGKDQSVFQSFLAYDPLFTGGVRVAVGDINGDGNLDIVTGPGIGGGPHIKVFSGTNLALLASYFPFDPFFAGGVYVAAGDVDADGKADIITGAGVGAPPIVNIVKGTNLNLIANFTVTGTQGPIVEDDFSAAPGVRVAARDVTGDGRVDIITGLGPFQNPVVRIFDPVSLSLINNFFAFDPLFRGGIFVAAAIR